MKSREKQIQSVGNVKARLSSLHVIKKMWWLWHDCVCRAGQDRTGQYSISCL